MTDAPTSTHSTVGYVAQSRVPEDSRYPELRGRWLDIDAHGSGHPAPDGAQRTIERNVVWLTGNNRATRIIKRTTTVVDELLEEA